MQQRFSNHFVQDKHIVRLTTSSKHESHLLCHISFEKWNNFRIWQRQCFLFLFIFVACECGVIGFFRRFRKIVDLTTHYLLYCEINDEVDEKFTTPLVLALEMALKINEKFHYVRKYVNVHTSTYFR